MPRIITGRMGLLQEICFLKNCWPFGRKHHLNYSKPLLCLDYPEIKVAYFSSLPSRSSSIISGVFTSQLLFSSRCPTLGLGCLAAREEETFEDLEAVLLRNSRSSDSPGTLGFPGITLRKKHVLRQEMRLLPSATLCTSGSLQGISVENMDFNFPTLFIIW